MFLLLSLPLTLTLSEYSLNKDIVLGGFCLGFFFSAIPHSMRDLSSLSWGLTYAPSLGSMGRTLVVSLESPVFQLQRVS